MEILTNSPGQTKKAGEVLAKEILKTKLSKGALIIGLEGDLGGGKTTFLQGFAKGLEITEKILSPTFVIMRKFQIARCSHAASFKFHYFYHIDCYRIKKPEEILDLGFREVTSNPRNIIAIEWAEKIRKTIPGEAIWVKFEFIDKTTRKIVLKY